MRTAVHVVHPYTYKLRDGMLVGGPIAEYADRDSALAEFMDAALDSADLYIFDHVPPRTLDSIVVRMAFIEDEHFSFLKHPAATRLLTLPNGVPVPAEKPEHMPLEHWKQVTELYPSVDAIGAALKPAEQVIIIGGDLGACVANWAEFYARTYREDEEVVIVPELAAVIQAEHAHRAAAIADVSTASLSAAYELLR